MASQLDGAGQIKLATLDDALNQLQRIHGIVERMGVALRAQQPVGAFRQQLHRAATPLVGLLKPQFGIVADQVTSLILIATRGGTDQTRLRALREIVAQTRAQLEISFSRVKEQHAVDAKGGAQAAAKTEPS